MFRIVVRHIQVQYKSLGDGITVFGFGMMNLRISDYQYIKECTNDFLPVCGFIFVSLMIELLWF